MTADALTEIRRHIDPMENVLWSGKPKQDIVFRGSDAFLIPFSLLWGGFAIFWMIGVIKSGAPLFFALFGVPFVLIGIYMIVGRFFVEAKQREKTYYGVTEDRVVIVSGILQQKVKFLTIRNLSDISISESSDGTGTITFGNAMPFFSWFENTSWPGTGQHAVPKFDMIDNPRQVYQIIREIQHGKSTN